MSPEQQTRVEHLISELDREYSQLSSSGGSDSSEPRRELDQARSHLRNSLILARRVKGEPMRGLSNVAAGSIPRFSVVFGRIDAIVVSGNGPLELSVSDPAPRGGANLTLTSSRPDILVLGTESIWIPGGDTKPVPLPQLFGVKPGESLISVVGSPYVPNSIWVKCVQR